MPMLSQRAAWVGVWAWAGVMACGARSGLVIDTGPSDGGTDSGAGSGSSGGSGSGSSGGASMTEAGPEASAPLAPAMANAAGGGFTCALLEGGTVACWGGNAVGQLGDGTSSGPQDCYGFPGCSTTPVAVPGLTGATAISAASGGHACTLLAGGTAACWGWNNYGQLGNGTSSGPETCAHYGPCSTTPVAVSGLTGATAISAGYVNTCALLAGGTVACWGDNSHGELGDGTTSGPQTCSSPGLGGGGCSPAPVAVTGLTGVTAVSAGFQFACALLSGGTVECWGNNAEGELGDGMITGPELCAYDQGGASPCSTRPVTVPGVTGATAISASWRYACAVVSAGAVMCWGMDLIFGASLGDGSTIGLSPTVVPGLTDVTAIAAGWYHTCALLRAGTVACWGLNDLGQLGDGTSTGPETCGGTPCSRMPVAVSGLTGATAISAGDLHTCAQLPGGTVVCWGANDDGALGDGTSTGPQECDGVAPCSTTPVVVLSL